MNFKNEQQVERFDYSVAYEKGWFENSEYVYYE